MFWCDKMNTLKLLKDLTDCNGIWTTLENDTFKKNNLSMRHNCGLSENQHPRQYPTVIPQTVTRSSMGAHRA